MQVAGSNRQPFFLSDVVFLFFILKFVVGAAVERFLRLLSLNLTGMSVQLSLLSLLLWDLRQRTPAGGRV